jgi:FkbM family methyltransferase
LLEENVTESDKRLANLFLRYAAPFAGLRKVPVLGDLLSWTGRRLVPTDSLVWVEIQEGAAKGLWMRVNPRTGQSVLSGLGEPLVQEALARYLLPAMTFYDLGANIGFFSLLGARLVGTTGLVYSFEADPEIAARLRGNLAFNNFLQTKVEQKAVWSETTTVSFERVDANTSPDRGLGHVSSGGATTAQTITVEAVSLDEYVTNHAAPDFVKCDVEGAEVAVFQGAARLLKEARPILLVETHSDENHRTLKQTFDDFGYDCRDLDGNHILVLPR